jgi:hypothetical protein
VGVWSDVVVIIIALGSALPAAETAAIMLRTETA